MAFHPQPLFFLVVGLVAGSLVPSAGVSLPIVLAMGIGAVLAVAAVVRPGSIPLAALVAAAFAAGAGLATGAGAAYEAGALPETVSAVEGAVLLVGRLVSDPQTMDDETRFDVDAIAVQAEGVVRPYHGRIRVFLKGPTQNAAVLSRPIEKGDVVRAWVDLRRPEGVRTPGGFDQLEWATREGVHAFATCKSGRLIEVMTPRSTKRTLLDAARQRLKLSWRHVTDPLNRAVTASMVLGDEGALDAVTRDEFRAAGLLHLLVVSGSQVAALIIGLRRVMPQALRISWPGCVVECMILMGYCLLAGAEDSIVRATVMAIAFAIATRVDLHRGGANFLAASALVLLAARPLDAKDPGAQMSFAATLALVSFAGVAVRRLRSWGVRGLLADVVAATAVASLAVAPLALMHFHRFSLIALPANLLAAPLAVLLLYASLATAALDLFVPGAAAISGAFCGQAAEGLRSLAHVAASIDPDWRGPSPPFALLLGFLGLIASSGWRRRAIPIAGLIAALTLSGLPAGDGRLHVWFLDVGQGDSILIETPGGRAGLIDAGPAFEKFDSGERVVAEALWALGHSRLEFMALTHRHADHEGGALFLGRHFNPEHIYVNGTSARMQIFASTTGVVRRGDSWSIDGVSFQVLGPDPAWPLPRGDENARSLVIEMRFGQTAILLLGDASITTENLIDRPVHRYDIVKVAHHGATTSSSLEIVRASRPRVAVISVGWRNRFSHPSPKVVERWSQQGALVWRTDLDRTLHVTSDGTRVVW